MRILSTILILAACVGCGTTSPSRKAELPTVPRARASLPEDLEAGTVDILGVHGPVEYWDGVVWSPLRPNMVLTNGAQLRPGADSCVNLRHDHCVTVRLTTDHRHNVEALVVRHLRGVDVVPPAPALEGGAISFSTAMQVQAGGMMARRSDADFAFYPDGKVEAVKGAVRVTGRGRTWALRNGDALETGAETPEKESPAGLAKDGAPGEMMAAWLVVSVPKSEPFVLTQGNPWRGTFGLVQ